MSKDLPQPQQSDEVDLGQLFKLIGNIFDRLFRFIGNIFIAIYDVILLFFIHIFKRLKWYIGAVVLGVVLGYFIDKTTPYLYGANMQIETNYNSARQVYENINYLNQLAAVDRDSVELGNRLGIKSWEAAAIKGFSIEPNVDENDKMILFSEFRSQLDSLTRSTYTYENYVEELSSYSFKTHQIEVMSTDKLIFPKLNSNLGKQLADNPYLNEIREVTLKNLDRKEKVLEDQKKALDSLKRTYLDIRRLESQKDTKSGSGTNFFLGETTQQNLIVDETKLVERQLELNEEKLQVYNDLIRKKYILNVISEFPVAGYNLGKLYEKAKVKLPILFLLIMLLFFIGLGLKKYLEKEEERLSNKKK